MTAAKELISNLVSKEWFTHHLVGVPNDNGLTFVDDSTIDEAGIVVRALAAPAPCLNLHLISLVGEFEHALRAIKQQATKVRNESKSKDVHFELVDDTSKLVALFHGVKLSFVADHELQWHPCTYQLEKIEIGRNIDCGCRDAEATCDLCAIAIEFGQQQPADASRSHVVVDLECKCALSRTHGSKTEAEHRHDNLKLILTLIGRTPGIRVLMMLFRSLSVGAVLALGVSGVVRADDSTTSTSSPSTTVIETPSTTAAVRELPLRSGRGRRAVYSIGQQHVWVVNADETIIRTFPVSGMKGQPRLGTYSVFSQSLNSFSPELPGVTFRYMTRFAIGRNGGNIGFHEIPVRNGKPMQTVEELGAFKGSGCLRSSTADARFMYSWAKPGTKVVVVP